MTTINKIKKNKSSMIPNDNNITITDDKMITEVLGNIGKKNTASKVLVNNFINSNVKPNIKPNIKPNTKVVKNSYQKKSNNNNNNENENPDKNDENDEIDGIGGEIEKKTFTSNLTKDDINEKLQDYKLVDDISTVPLGTHLRYFVIKDDKKLFRMGGNLKRNLDLPKFVVLVNALGTEWTVQIKDTTFYKKMSIKEIKDEYDGIIEELHEKIKKYKSKIEEKDNIISELQEIIKNSNSNSNSKLKPNPKSKSKS